MDLAANSSQCSLPLVTLVGVHSFRMERAFYVKAVFQCHPGVSEYDTGDDGHTILHGDRPGIGLRVEVYVWVLESPGDWV